MVILEDEFLPLLFQDSFLQFNVILIVSFMMRLKLLRVIFILNFDKIVFLRLDPKKVELKNTYTAHQK